MNTATQENTETPTDTVQITYGGFWRRFGAAIIDGLILTTIMGPLFFLNYSSQLNYFLVSVLTSALSIVYAVVFHQRFGKTIGKMVVGVKLVRLDLSPVTWKEALLRDSVEIGLSIIGLVGTALAIHNSDPSFWLTAPRLLDVTLQLKDLNPLLSATTWISNIWILSELVTLLFNKKKRALHDFIAGTVVVVKR